MPAWNLWVRAGIADISGEVDELARRPLSARESSNPAAWGGPYEGVPGWLLVSLLDWIALSFPNYYQHDSRHELLQVQRELHLYLNWGSTSWAMQSLLDLMSDQAGVALDVVDWGAKTADLVRVGALSNILEEAGSEWTVTQDAEGQGQLTRRLDPTVTSLVQTAAPTGTNQAIHLASSWSGLYGRNPNPGDAYREAVKAVEAAAIPVVSPNNSRATLGTIIGEMNANPSNWVVILPAAKVAPEIGVVISMLELLWGAQGDRHGTANPSGPVQISQEQAEAALQLAATLVHWFSSGAIRRV